MHRTVGIAGLIFINTTSSRTTAVLSKTAKKLKGSHWVKVVCRGGEKDYDEVIEKVLALTLNNGDSTFVSSVSPGLLIKVIIPLTA